MPWAKTGITYYHAQLGLSDKGRAKKIVECLLGVTLPNTRGN